MPGTLLDAGDTVINKSSKSWAYMKQPKCPHVMGGGQGRWVPQLLPAGSHVSSPLCGPSDSALACPRFVMVPWGGACPHLSPTCTTSLPQTPHVLHHSFLQ